MCVLCTSKLNHMRIRSNTEKYRQFIIFQKEVETETTKSGEHTAIQTMQIDRSIKNSMAAGALYQSAMANIKFEDIYASKRDVLIAHQAGIDCILRKFPKSPIADLNFITLPYLNYFRSRVDIHNSNLLKTFVIKDFIGFENYIFNACILIRFESLYDEVVDEIVNAITPCDVFYLPEKGLREWVFENLQYSRSEYDSLQHFLEQYLLQNKSNQLSVTQYGVLLKLNPLDLSEFRQQCARGTQLIQQFIGLEHQLLISSTEMAADVCRNLLNIYDQVMKHIIKKNLVAQKELTSHHDYLESYLIDQFALCWKLILEHKYLDFAKDFFIGFKLTNIPYTEQFVGRPKMKNQISQLRLNLSKELAISFKKWCSLSKSNISKMLTACKTLLKDCMMDYEHKLIEAQEKSASVEKFKSMNLELSASICGDLKKQIAALEYPINPSDFCQELSSQINATFQDQESCSQFKINTIDNTRSNDNIVPELPSLTLVIDFNLSMIRVAGYKTHCSSELVSAVSKILPCIRISKTNNISIGSVAQEEKGDTDEVFFYLEDVIDKDQITQFHPCYINGVLSRTTRSDFILALFFAKLKHDIERKLSGNWNNLAIGIPLRFTMGQRLIVKQAAIIAGFATCTLINNTSAAAYELSEYENIDRNLLTNFFICVKNRDVIDVASYSPIIEDSDNRTCLKIQTCFTNIPVYNSDKWFKDILDNGVQGDQSLLYWTLSCLTHAQSRYNKNKHVWRGCTSNEHGHRILEENCEAKWSYENKNIVSFGLAKIFRRYKVQKLPISKFIKDIIPYPIFVSFESKQFKLEPENFPYNTKNLLHLSKNYPCEFQIAEWCCNQFYALGTIKIGDVPTGERVFLKYKIEPNGCFNFESINSDTRCIFGNWGWAGGKQHPCNPRLWKTQIERNKEKLAKTVFKQFTKLDSQKLMLLFIEDIEQKLVLMENVVHKTFISQSLQQLRSELASDSSDEDTVEAKYTQLTAFCKLYLKSDGSQ